MATHPAASDRRHETSSPGRPNGSDAGEPLIPRPRMSNPMPVAFALLAFALAIYGVRYVNVNPATLNAGPTSEAVIYAFLVAAIALITAGVLALIRGQAFDGYLATMFGVGLLGLYLLLTRGAVQKDFTPDAVGWYALVLLVPVVIMAVPQAVKRNVPQTTVIAAIAVVLLFLGLAYHHLNGELTDALLARKPPDVSGVITMLKVSAYAAFVAAAALWYLLARDVYRASGILGTVPPYQAS